MPKSFFGEKVKDDETNPEPLDLEDTEVKEVINQMPRRRERTSPCACQRKDCKEKVKRQNIFEALACEGGDDELCLHDGSAPSAETQEELKLEDGIRPKGEGSAPAESREPLESLLTRCDPKLSMGPSTEMSRRRAEVQEADEGRVFP